MWVKAYRISEIQIIQLKEEPELNEITRNHRCGLKDPYSCSSHPLVFAQATASLCLAHSSSISLWVQEAVHLSLPRMWSSWASVHIHTGSHHRPHMNFLHHERRGLRISYHMPWVLVFPPHFTRLKYDFTLCDSLFLHLKLILLQ